MPKMKTKKSVAKRFSVTGTGKIKRAHDGKNHILTKKTRKRKRNLKKAAYVSKQYERNIKAMM
ncbi:MAG: 50S ribosomal protein L35 [Clostridia bacterium]|nr:50S ribosomal protein L35 [Clostridia bacterium]